MSTGNDVENLRSLLKEALSSAFILKWGYFFPFHIAVWGLIEGARPGLLGRLNATYDHEPIFYGKGAKWFTEELGNKPDYLDDVEKFMYWMFSKVPPPAKDRGFLYATEVPDFDSFDSQFLQRMVDTVLRHVDEARARGELSVGRTGS
jgi:hypothetical protein